MMNNKCTHELLEFIKEKNITSDDPLYQITQHLLELEKNPLLSTHSLCPECFKEKYEKESS
jgi:hypothetical protein